MGLDPTSFVLEIVNFLVLTWLLKRLLYQPIQDAIAKRQHNAEQARSALEAAQRDIEKQRKTLIAESATASEQRDAALAKLAAEIDEEHKRRLAVLDAEMVSERTKRLARLTAQEQRQREAQDRSAAERADSFLRGYLERLAGPALEQAVVELFLTDLAAVPEQRRGQLASVPEDSVVDVTTAFDADDSLRQRVAVSIATLLGRQARLRWAIDPAVVSGICVRLDGHQLETSLASSLECFHATAVATP
ncbi:F0F1 ATP synthase subunit delta [Ralstonia chuxiongensis]|uniref:F0F1 ATP synthase subunit delta n=1 Tax=Ralstonia chuxiongensis TaxID=2957504 RepID=UPI0028F4EDCF|nr:F0F1 ATP synthase subunit delta [Ralstonia chuxiongensis]CAJ0780286.1 ATP synthase subunit b [Ralstonia chuxiongensis]